MAREVAHDQFECPGCGETKHRCDFYAPRTKHTEVSHYCKACTRALRKRERKGTRAFEVRGELRQSNPKENL